VIDQNQSILKCLFSYLILCFSLTFFVLTIFCSWFGTDESYLQSKDLRERSYWTKSDSEWLIFSQELILWAIFNVKCRRLKQYSNLTMLTWNMRARLTRPRDFASDFLILWICFLSNIFERIPMIFLSKTLILYNFTIMTWYHMMFYVNYDISYDILW